jgi:uncharacterized protein YycO
MGKKCTLRQVGITLAATALLSTGIGVHSTYASEEGLPPEWEKESSKARQAVQLELENWSNEIDQTAVEQALRTYYGSEKTAKVMAKKDIPGAVLVTPDTGDGSGKIVGHAGIFSRDIKYSVEAFPKDGVVNVSGNWDKRYKRFKKFYISKSEKGQYDQAAAFAWSQIGKPYSIATNKNSTKKYYCSKLVWKSWKSQGKDLDKDGGYWVFPSDISGDNDVVVYYSK